MRLAPEGESDFPGRKIAADWGFPLKKDARANEACSQSGD
jgi:hypothetical protein